MKHLMKFIWLVAIVIIILVALPLYVGWYLSPQDPLQKVDAIVVISGGDSDARISKGVQLYKEGWAKNIIFSGAAASGNVSNARAMANIAEKSGVPDAAIFLDENSKTTAENAQFCAELIRQKGFKSIVLVTGPYHQRRAFDLFKQNLGQDFLILNQSALDNSWRKKGWWENNVGRFLTAGEVSKIVVIYFQELTQKVQK